MKTTSKNHPQVIVQQHLSVFLKDFLIVAKVAIIPT
jgi:hypothetical protein